MKAHVVARTIALILILLAFGAPAAGAQSPRKAACTYRATFISDVTMPDNTITAPGKPFVKTWRLRNDGTCPWGPGTSVDSLEMVGGTMMTSATRVPLNESVKGGQSANISIKMQAPAAEGVYRSDWKFRRSNGQLFGLGASGATPFYVQIIARGGTPEPPPQGERINFPPGATVASVQGRVSDTGMKSYVVRARGGQWMRVALVSANRSANFSVVGLTDGQPYKRVEVGDPFFTLVLPSTQDYQINVRVAAGTGTASYILSMAIAP